MQNISMKEIQDHYINLVKDNYDINKQSFIKSYEYLESSTAKYHGEVIDSLYIPKIFPDNVVKYLDESINTMYSILIKVIKEYLNNEEYRKLFGFDKKLEELILTDRGYDSLLPICRLDIFLNEENLSFKFCEFNADGTSSMNEDRELNIALKYTDAYQRLSKEYRTESFELFDSWVREFEQIYSTYKNKVDKPNIAVVDFLEKGCSMYEFEEFRKSFEKAGYIAEVCEIRDLCYKDNALYSPSGMRVDSIYRRAVTSDIMEHLNEVEDFIRAVKEEKVCLVGNFCTQVIHNKILFKLLFDERTQRFLTEQEIKFVNEHIPYTARLLRAECNFDDIIKNKDKWIIKPEDSYGARGVYAGVNFDAMKWESLVNENADNHYLVQEFYMPYQSLNIDFSQKTPEFRMYSNLTGLYVYNGKFKGIYSRQSKKEIISSQYDENDVASIVTKER